MSRVPHETVRVPTKDYGRQYAGLMPELLPEIERVLRQDDPILGDAVTRFETECAAWFGSAYAVGVNSGTDALILALRALGIGRGDEVVTTGHTFHATIGAIVTVGARPVLLDPDPVTMNLAAPAVAAALAPSVRAVLPVHMYGLAAPMPEIEASCRRHGCHLLEDVAQAHGARAADGRRAGTFGAAGCLSFHPSKNLGAFGDGGMVLTGEAEVAERLRVLRNLGRVSKHEIREIAGNTKLDTLQAAILRVKLRHLDAWNARRRRLAARYRERLADLDDLVLPHDPGSGQHVYHLFVVRSPRRDALRAFLAARGVKTGVHYPIPPHRQPLDRDLGYPRGSLPVTEAIAATCVSLPLSPELHDAEIDLVCDVMRSFHGR